MKTDMIKAIIIDDEEHALNYLKNLVTTHIPEITTIKTALGAKDGLELIKSFKPNLVFLDIEMPYLNGFELLNKLDEWNFAIIYTTAFHKYAIKAIKFSALDYLLKPIDPKELIAAVNRYVVQKHIIHKQNNQFKNLLENLKKKEPSEFKLALPTKDGMYMYDLFDIVRIEADMNYSTFHFNKKPKILVAKTLKEYADLLSDHGFIRIHKSHLINRKHVKTYNNTGKIMLHSGIELDVSRRRRRSVKKELGVSE